MPNHYTTVLFFEGPDSDTTKLAAAIAELHLKACGLPGGLCEYVRPMPEALRNVTNYDGWYHWALRNWGTKWGTYDHEVDGCTLSFYSAWSPPLDEILQGLADKTGLSFYAEGQDEGEEDRTALGDYNPDKTHTPEDVPI